MFYRLETHLLFGIVVSYPSKHHLDEIKNNACIKEPKNRTSRLEFLALFAKNHFQENSTFTNLILLFFMVKNISFF